jgi:hypothetical protein
MVIIFTKLVYKLSFYQAANFPFEAKSFAQTGWKILATVEDGGAMVPVRGLQRDVVYLG